MKLLVLGGTQFLGRHLVAEALARGHRITLFNRGQSNPDLFPEAETLKGDRDGNLDALKGREWDVVIDTCGYVSSQVRASAGLLASAVEHYIFISSISVYADFSQAGMDEFAPLAVMAAGAEEKQGDWKTYGARKVRCEQAIEQIMPGRVLHIRPGVIMGPHDSIGRFTYWVRRLARGGEVLAPEHAGRPMQLTDARDLAAWMVRLMERREVGIYNAAGPELPLTFGRMLEACRTASDREAEFVWVEGKFLIEKGVAPYQDLPLWVPESATEYAGHFAVNSRRAFEAGLTCRPLVETAREILVWEREEELRGTGRKIAGIIPEREGELLKLWRTERP